MADATTKLDGQDNSVRRRTPGDFMRSGDSLPYWWDGQTTKRDGEPKLKRAGRSSNAGYGVKPQGFALQRHKEVSDFCATALMIDEAYRQLGAYPELWDLTSKRTREIIDSLLVEGRERAGVWIKANRGTLIHTVLELVALAIIAGDDPADVDLAPLIDEAEDLGMGQEVLEAARELFIEFFDLYAEPLFAEARTVHPGYNFAGTADLVVRWKVSPCEGVEAGDVTGSDLKTGRVDGFTKISQCAQLAAYFGPGAMRYQIDDDDDPGRPVEWPEDIRRDVAVIVQVPLDDALQTGELLLRLHVVDLDAGVEVLDRAKAMAEFDVPDHLRSPLDALRRNLSDSALVRDLTASLALVKHEQMLDWFSQRLTVIVEHPKGTELLVELWPSDDIPRTAVKERTLDPEHVQPIHRLISHIEAELHLPFGPSDPRAAKTGHRVKTSASTV
jgi:hypothetical protein